jgi:hypothetical protein
MWSVEVTSGFDMDVLYQPAGAVASLQGATPTTENVGVITADTSATSASFNATVSEETGLAYLNVAVYSTSAEATSWSDVVLRITTWIDEVTAGNSDGVRDADEWYTTKTLTLTHASRLTFTAAHTTPTAGDTYVTGSATVTGLNFRNLTGKFFLAASSSKSLFYPDVYSQQASSSPIGGTTLEDRAGVVSSSWVTQAVSESSTVSLSLRYDKAGTGGTYTAGLPVGAVTAYAVAPAVVTALSASAVAGNDISGSNTAYTVRANKTYTVKVWAGTNSASVSGAAVEVTLTGTGLVTGSKMISVNGGSYLTTYPNAFTVTTGTGGYGSFTIAATGFVADEYVDVDLAMGNISSTTVRLTTKDATYQVASDYSLYTTQPGTAVTIPFTVKDQWGVSSALSNHYLKITRGGDDFSYATTLSYEAVVAGSDAFAFTPEAATTTGSATVQAQVVKLVNGAYVNDGSDTTVTVNVSSAVDSFSTGLATSYSSSVSYFPSTVSWTTVTAKVANTGSAVVVAGDNIIFRASSALPTTYSGAITVRSSGTLEYTFEMASMTAGSHAFTLTNGTASTSSLFVVDAVSAANGSAITFDTTAIAAGKTKVVTGTVVDANGNPVDTTVGAGTASIVVTYTGTAGIPVGTMPTETDANGQFRVSILTSAADQGTFTLTATYLKDGASTATADKVTAVQEITVGAVSSEASADQKVNAGSFKGYVAVYAKGYKGQRMSAKIGNDWVVVESLESDFERVTDFTGAGYTIAVRIYIDRVLVDTITVTTK